MRRQAISVFLVGFAVVVCAAAKEETVEALKSRVESAPLGRPSRPAIQIARASVRIRRQALHRWQGGGRPRCRRRCCHLFRKSPRRRDRKQEALKNVEIDVRKIADRLRDIKRTLAFEDQPPVEQAIRKSGRDSHPAAQRNVWQGNKRRRNDGVRALANGFGAGS